VLNFANLVKVCGSFSVLFKQYSFLPLGNEGYCNYNACLSVNKKLVNTITRLFSGMRMFRGFDIQLNQDLGCFKKGDFVFTGDRALTLAK